MYTKNIGHQLSSNLTKIAVNAINRNILLAVKALVLGVILLPVWRRTILRGGDRRKIVLVKEDLRFYKDFFGIMEFNPPLAEGSF